MPTCHTRYDNGQIDQQAMQAYKRDAGWRNTRYSDLERRLLTRLATESQTDIWVFAGLLPLLSQVLTDGLLVDSRQTRPADLPENFRERLFRLTAAGEALVAVLCRHEPTKTRGAHG